MKKISFYQTNTKSIFNTSYLKSGILLLLCTILAPATFSQSDSTQVKPKEDTTRIVVGNKEIQIIDAPSDNDTEVHIKDRKEKENNRKGWSSGGFKGHWAGLEIGLNNYLNNDYAMVVKDDDEFMSLNTNRSLNVNLNFIQHSFGIIGNRLGMVTGLGFEFYNYFFEHNNSIIANDEGVIISKPYNVPLDKSKLTLTYLTLPLIFEFQFPGQLKNSRRLRMSVGVIGGVKLGSHTKVVYRENGEKKKEKSRDDFNINSLRYGFTARVGYKHINIYSNFYPVSLFEKDKGPLLYPISVGIGFAIN